MLRVVETANRMVGIVTPPEGSQMLYHLGGHKDARYLQFTVPSIWLPPGNWQLLGRASEITEEQSKEIVEVHVNSNGKGFKHYWQNRGFVPRGFNSIHKTALSSFRSWCTLHGVKEGDLIILEK